VVQKYGGTSVADAARIGNVARRIVATFEQGNSVSAVVSARGDTTDELVELAREITPDPPEREMDMLLSAGERISCALLAMAIHRLGYDAVSLTGSQAGIVTDTVHTKARILDIHPGRVQEAMDDGKIVLVAGFQGVSTEKDVTTLGRGGSDTTAVALAHALHADVCEIYTDVDGVYTADPRIVKTAKKIKEISYDEMLELASLGTKVMQSRSVEFAKKYGVVFEVRSSFNQNPGTIVKEEVAYMEKVVVRGVAVDKDQAKVVISNLPDKPASAATIFTALADASINVDMIVQNVAHTGGVDLTFTVQRDDVQNAVKVLPAVLRKLGGGEVKAYDNIAKLSVVGVGMRTHAGVAATLFTALGEAGINIQLIGTSEIKITVAVDRARADEATRAAHAVFGLDK
jgi:aspartate kinase